MERKELHELSSDDSDVEPHVATTEDEGGLKNLVDNAANAAINAAKEVLGDAWSDESMMLVVIDQTKPPDNQPDSCATAIKADEPATIKLVMEALIGHAIVCAKAAGMRLDIIGVPTDASGAE